MSMNPEGGQSKSIKQEIQCSALYKQVFNVNCVEYEI